MTEALTPPTEPEDRLVRMLLDGTRGAMPALQRQWAHARIKRRSFDAWGMTATIWVPLDTSPVDPPEQQFADVIFRVEGHGEWLSAVLLVERGVLTEFGMQSVRGELLPRASLVELTYCITVEDPADPMELTVLPVPERDWGEVE